MKVNLNQLGTQETQSTTATKRMKLDENAVSMVFQMFTKLIYSNPIGTIVREITSNCFDSHVEAGVKVPVRIKKTVDKKTGVIYISFIDYGVGMSPERVEEIYMTYFKSTKRTDNTQIGGFGIGGKTPLAYKRSTGFGEAEYDNSYEIITVFNGIKYTYLVYEGAETPEVSEPMTEECTEHNGTEVRIPVLEKDLSTFSKELVRQLYYFENIIFEGFDDDYRYGETLMNEYQIVRGKTFLYRGSEYADQMHVCLGRVAYPLDYNVLGLNYSDYRLPIAVKVEIGEIGTTASREQLDYSEKTIKVLKKKLEETKAEIKELLAKQYSNIVTLEDYFQVKNEFGTLNFGNGMSIRVGNLIAQKDVDFSNFKYSFMKMPNDRQLFRFFFEVKSYGKKPSRNRYSSSYSFEGDYKTLINEPSALYYCNDEFNRKVIKQAYLKQEEGLFHILTKRDLTDSYMRTEIAEIFNVAIDKTTDDNGKPVAYVQSLIDMQEEYMSIVQRVAKDYDAVEVPADFIEGRKNKNKISKEMRSLNIPVKFIGHYSKSTVLLDALFNYNSTIFYGTQDDETALSNANNLYCALFDEKACVSYFQNYGNNPVFYNGYNRKGITSKKSIMFIMLAKNNVKYMEFCKKAYHVSEFFNKMLCRKEVNVLSYFQTYDIKIAWDNVESMYKLNSFSKINEKWGKKIRSVNDFIKALPEASQNIGYMKDQLGKYFDLSNIKQTAEQKAIAKTIAEIKDLQKSNNKNLNYVNMPYHMDEIKQDFADFLKKVMTF